MDRHVNQGKVFGTNWHVHVLICMAYISGLWLLIKTDVLELV